MDKEKNVGIVEKFKGALVGKFALSKLILFGSRARGNFRNSSDFDLVVVSDDFNGIRSYKRMGLLRKYWGYEYSVDMLCLTNEEFERVKDNRQTIIGIAVKEGIEI